VDLNTMVLNGLWVMEWMMVVVGEIFRRYTSSTRRPVMVVNKAFLRPVEPARYV